MSEEPLAAKAPQSPVETLPGDVAASLRRLRAEIDAAVRAAGREPASVRLVGVSKRQTRATIEAAIAAGLGELGENYLQEARDKFVPPLPEVVKHYIGHIQTNKAKAIVELFDVVQSIDRPDAADAISKAARTLGKRVRALVQVNISPSDRFGIAPELAAALAQRMRKEGLEVDGIMAIAPNTRENGAIVRAFQIARDTFDRVGGSTLSIGMSGDWREAILNGSTMLRIGTAIFGART